MRRNEFGSDFHFQLDLQFCKNYLFHEINFNFYANGRHAIADLIRNNSWKRIWVSEYFCYEVIKTIQETLIDVKYYPDSPLSDDNQIINKIDFKTGDVLFRMNYFGLRGWRDNSKIPVPVIEDHSHDLIGEWAKQSNADWCICSLRKTLPLSEGGALWSPKDLKLPNKPNRTIENDLLSSKRMNAMLLKTLYLNGENVDKDVFRGLFVETEHTFDTLPISKISEESLSIFNKIDIETWYQQKKNNWISLFNSLKNKVSILQPENEYCNPFSLILKFDKDSVREECRIKLINLKIYPAVLWTIPKSQSENSISISNKVLSIHCDARYSIKDIEKLIINLISII